MQSLQTGSWPYPRVLAHRGGGKMAPENTLAAMQCGVDYGYRAVEFDVMLSKDGVPVLMHDRSLAVPFRLWQICKIGDRLISVWPLS